MSGTTITYNSFAGDQDKIAAIETAEGLLFTRFSDVPLGVEDSELHVVR